MASQSTRTDLADFSRIAAIRALPGQGIPLLQMPNPVDTGAWPSRAALAEYAQAIRDVADEQNVVLVDHFAQWSADFGDTPPAGLLGDGLHRSPTSRAISCLPTRRSGICGSSTRRAVSAP